MTTLLTSGSVSTGTSARLHEQHTQNTGSHYNTELQMELHCEQTQIYNQYKQTSSGTQHTGIIQYNSHAKYQTENLVQHFIYNTKTMHNTQHTAHMQHVMYTDHTYQRPDSLVGGDSENLEVELSIVILTLR